MNKIILKPLYDTTNFEIAKTYLRELILADRIINDDVLKYANQMLDKNKKRYVTRNNKEYIATVKKNRILVQCKRKKVPYLRRFLVSSCRFFAFLRKKQFFLKKGLTNRMKECIITNVARVAELADAHV